MNNVSDTPSYMISSTQMPTNPVYFLSGTNMAQTWLCPDMLSIRNVGPADSWRGHVVRAFLRVLKWITGV